MKIQLVDLNRPLVKEWTKQFKGCKDVDIHCDSIFDIPTDCFVSPANAFGFLDGGIDNAIRKYYNDKDIDIEKIVQHDIKRNHFGEILVGEALYFQLNYLHSVPDLIVAPTMRVPMKLPEDSVNVYLCMRAILLAIKKNHINPVRTFSMSGLGTGIGQVPYDICAKQMKQAYDDIWLGKYKFPTTWAQAQENHQLLYGDEVRDIQYEKLNLKGNKLWDKD